MKFVKRSLISRLSLAWIILNTFYFQNTQQQIRFFTKLQLVQLKRQSAGSSFEKIWGCVDSRYPQVKKEIHYETFIIYSNNNFSINILLRQGKRSKTSKSNN
ncbi:MAG: hypothetical protein DRJ01_13420 [Bacteroidetes bacterium]|nr:MAG: hypothetical protein DRJ01_13420 [Bacteroidota bacterium]